MLNSLYIENIAVIEKTEIHFTKGLNVLTGETGAGKSIIIDSINAILGSRTSKEIIRTGENSAYISASFSEIDNETKEILSENGYYQEDDGSLIITREVKLDGRNVCRIGSRPAPLSILRRVAPSLISIQGQHESYELLSDSGHIKYIDALCENAELLEKYQIAFEKLKKIGKQIDMLEIDEEEKARRSDILLYQINELENADIKIGEKEELTQIRDTASNMQEIIQELSLAIECVDSMQGAGDRVSAASDAVIRAARLYPQLCDLSEKLIEINDMLAECEKELIRQSEVISVDESELDNISERLDVLYRLSQKYGRSEEEMLKFLEKAKDDLSSIEHSEELHEKLLIEYEAAKNEAVALAKNLSKIRREASEVFTKKVIEELKFLNMPGVVFEVSQSRAPLSSLGCDNISFRISANPGEELRPLSKIASGGELSRIMLAIKTVLSGKGDGETMIFDEIDSGISGSAAQKTSMKLKEISKSVQVLCVTHLPSMAAYADTHFLIEKQVENGKTYTKVRALSFEERKLEISRMLSGENITKSMLESAEEMLAGANIE